MKQHTQTLFSTHSHFLLNFSYLVAFPHNMKPQNIFLFICILVLGTLVVQTHTISSSHLANETDQLALLEFKSCIAANEILNMWNESVPHCQWPGVTCGHKHHRVTALDLTEQNLLGPISPHIGNLSFLRRINLTTNRLNGEIPQELGRLFRLRNLILYGNALVGEIPLNLSYCKELKVMDLTTNHLMGEIPVGLGSLKKLVTLELSGNKFSGEIQPSLGNLSSLQVLFLADNNFQGTIPNELSKLTNLAYLGISSNNISGAFPPYLFNISSITAISTAVNPISGRLPIDIGFTLPHLRFLDIGQNLFTGTIPKSLANASQLSEICMPGNGFVGQVPHSLGSLPNLHILNLELNQLGGDPSHDLSFLEPLSNCTNLKKLSIFRNNMTGNLPDSIANLSFQLEALRMGGNKIYGTIPETTGNLVNLYTLSIEENKLSGIIPSSLGRLKRLQVLYLHHNLLSGEIPYSFGDLNELSELILFNNRLEGHIPPSIGHCKRMQYLGLSNNNFSGSIPPQVMGIASLLKLKLSNNQLSGPLPEEVGKLISLNTLEISHNNLSGEIPAIIGDCLSIEYLNIRENSFSGNIPYTLPNLKGIQYLDLSQNSLYGKIPEGVEDLVYLQYLNLSFNDLEGEIPTRGVFENTSEISLAGNSKLCGGMPALELPLCHSIKANKKHKLTIALVCVAFFLFVVTLSGVLYGRRKKISISIPSLEVKKHRRISYRELHRATNGFSSENAIGSGSFGTVYRAKLNQQVDKFVAVKVLNLCNSRASKSFVAECKILRSIRHRNLVKILTYCSSSDYSHNEFKALVYEYMPNGNLDIWLHPDEASGMITTLNLLQRLNIAIDVASALHYLHNNCEPPVVHCDLKPSNILLDAEMCAHVGDFGLARFLPKTNGVVSENSSIGVKGTIGYAAPEYGTGGEISTHGDVYAYGILLLEMITGRRPTDDIFKDGLNLHRYVKSALPSQVLEIVDPVLHNEQQEAPGEAEDRENEIVEMNNQGYITESTSNREFEENIIAILSIALACSEESPSNRIDMNYVTWGLQSVKDAILLVIKGAGSDH